MMRKRIAAAAFCLPALAWAQALAEDPLAWLGWMKDLAGACWQGTDAAGKPIDRQCYELQFGRFLRGTIEMGAAEGRPPAFRGDSLFHREPKTGRIAIVLWASNGSVSGSFDRRTRSTSSRLSDCTRPSSSSTSRRARLQPALGPLGSSISKTATIR